MNPTSLIRAKHSMYADARKHYFAGTYTQKEIAELTGVPIRTLYDWIKDGQWEQLRRNANQVPALILENLVTQLTALQKQILSREESSCVPTHLEAETQRKLIAAITNINAYPAATIRALAEGTHPIADLVFSAETRETEPPKTQ